MNPHIYAEYYLHKTLLEDELFQSQPDLIADHERPPIPEEDRDILTNLLGRLNSSAAVKSAMTASLSIVHRAAGIEDLGNKGIRSSKQPSQSHKRSSDSPSVRDTKSPLSSQFIRSDAPIPESLTDEEEEKSGNASGLDQEQWLDVTHRDAELDESEDEQEDEDRHQHIKTTFLPSLSAGYIPASDDSDPDEELQSFAPMKKERKNRRGQRERQGIWLKKYGKNARHLQKENEQEKQKEKSLSKDKKYAERRAQKAYAEATRESTGDSNIPKETKVNETHPSWIAKQKMREQQKAMLSSVKPQKIKFD